MQSKSSVKFSPFNLYELLPNNVSCYFNENFNTSFLNYRSSFTSVVSLFMILFVDIINLIFIYLFRSGLVTL